MAVQQAIAEGRLEAALALLANAKDFESPELTWLRDHAATLWISHSFGSANAAPTEQQDHDDLLHRDP